MDAQNAQLPAEETKTAKQRRRWIEAWPVLIPVALIGGLLWFGLWYQRRAQLFEDAGYLVFDAPTWSLIETWGGPEMRSLIGSPSSLHVGGEHPTSRQMRMIGGFSELTDLTVRGLNDSDLASLRGLSKLKDLRLYRSSVSDAGLAALADFPDLERLFLQTDQRLSGAGIESLRELRNLRSVDLNGTGLTDQDLEPLGSLDALESLSLRNAALSGDGLKHIAEHPGLRILDLQECEITPAALKPLAKVTGSLRLGLNGSTITDEHLEVLGKVRWLELVLCPNTQVTRAACVRFAQAHPGVTIVDADEKQHLVEVDYDSPSLDTEFSGTKTQAAE